MANDPRQTIDLLVKHASVHTLDAENHTYADGALAVHDGEILAVGETTDLEQRFAAAQVRDASGLHLIPGLVNNHNHLFQVFARTKAKDLTFIQWIENGLLPLIQRLDPETTYLAAMVGCMEAVRSGTTTLLDYMYVANRPGLCEGVLRAFEEIGLRGILGRGFNTRKMLPWGIPSGTYEPAGSAMQNLLQLERQLEGSQRLSLALAPGAVWSISDESLEIVRDYLQRGKLVTIHLQENEIDDEHCLKIYGKRTIPFMADSGLLGPNLLAVHSVQMPPENMQLYVEHGVAVSHNPASNMILGSGVAPITEMLEKGLRVGVATDGAASNDSQNMIEAMKLAALLQKGFLRDTSALGAQQALEMATRIGAQTVGMGDLTGSLEAGKRADFVLLDMNRSNTFPAVNFAAALVYAGEPGNVKAVAVDGELIYDNGAFTHVDEAAILRQAWKKSREIEEDIGRV